MFKLALFALSIITLAGCTEETDSLRLDHTVLPRFQHIFLTLDPDSDSYSGRVEIQISVTEKTDTFRFHAQDLDIHSIELKSNTSSYPLQYVEGEKGTVTASHSAKLSAGQYTLKIGFSNTFSHQGIGIYKVAYEGKNYLFTQMEPEYARKSFPCWDAPEFKIPWELQLTVPGEFDAYANTPLISRKTDEHIKELVFATSKPMPSYLVAFAVGRFEKADIPDFPTAGGIIVPLGKTGLAGEASRISAPLLKALQEYFELPYPYRKLDQIAVPEFNFGAMENAGLITYRDTALLRDPKAITLGQKQWLASIVAHEMSHMWFGNLVTPVWWDDLWLNESFASWIALKTVNRTFPEYEMQNDDIKSRQSAFDDDALSTSRPIRRPIAASDDMAHLFDRLAYNKGMAVLDMVEDWMGETAFRQGMIRYMSDHAWGNTDAFDLAESLGEFADGEIRDIMTGFVSQTGIPLLVIERVGDSMVRIRQQRYAHYGVVFDDAPEWCIPISLKSGNGDDIRTHKFLLRKATQIFELGSGVDWIYPNANEKGYYRWRLKSSGSLTELAGAVKSMGIRNRLGFISNTESLFYAGFLNGGEFIQTLSSFSMDTSPEVRLAVVHSLDRFGDGMITPEREKQYGKYLHSVLQPMLDEIGLQKQPDENALIEKLRPALINALGWRCKDEAILNMARDQAQSYINDPYSVDPSLARPCLRLAAMVGGESLFKDYTEKYEASTVPIEKENYLHGLSGFRDRALMEQALDYVLTDRVPPHQFRIIPNRIADTDINRSMVLEWLKKNYPSIQGKIPEQSISYLPWLACGQSPDLLNAAKNFLLVDERRSQGLEVEFGKVDAVVTLHMRLRGKEQDNIRHFLEAQ